MNSLRAAWAVGVVLWAGCSERAASASSTPPAIAGEADAGSRPFAATVNGRGITHLEVVLRLRGMPAATPEQALDAIVADELRAQRALELGLDRDPAFLEELGRLEAQVSEVKRRELSKVFLHREVLERAEATDAEVKAFVEQHRSRFTSRVKVLQLLRRDRAAIDQLEAQLGRGARFEDLVLQGVGGAGPVSLQDATVGPLSWEQVPPAWWDALERLQPGQVSGVIAPPGGPFTLLKLVERESVEAPAFERLAPAVRAMMKGERIEQLKASTDEALRRAARVTRQPLTPVQQQ